MSKRFDPLAVFFIVLKLNSAQKLVGPQFKIKVVEPIHKTVGLTVGREIKLYTRISVKVACNSKFNTVRIQAVVKIGKIIIFQVSLGAMKRISAIKLGLRSFILRHGRYTEKHSDGKRNRTIK